MIRKKTLTQLSIICALTVSTTSLYASSWEINEKKCALPETTPIIPDGNIASEDELFSAQQSVKSFQETLLDYRECLAKKEAKLDPEAEESQARIAQLRKLSDESIDFEKTVAEEFNQAVRAFKER